MVFMKGQMLTNRFKIIVKKDDRKYEPEQYMIGETKLQLTVVTKLSEIALFSFIYGILFSGYFLFVFVF